jgi:PII-like signaling protein
MHTTGKAQLLRIFIGEDDSLHGKPLYQVIVRRCRELDMAGATVLLGREGFGKSSLVHTSRLLRLSQDLPVVIELVDTEERLGRFTRELDTLFEEAGSGGLVTIENVTVLKYSAAPIDQ